MPNAMNIEKYLPIKSKCIEAVIDEIIDQYDSNIPSLKIAERIISCKGKAKLSEGNYPIEFYLLLEDKDEFIFVESQGKRKWIFKWKI